ncbi:MAG: hypothetical protein FWE04_00640, partial [Oscillospiraceae bacterium]|nr:hypothetical protein [Oscillospiraceae bacterium]
AVNRTQSNFANRRLVFLDGFHRGGISRIPKTDSEATPKAAICTKAGDKKTGLANRIRGKNAEI